MGEPSEASFSNAQMGNTIIAPEARPPSRGDDLLLPMGIPATRRGSRMSKMVRLAPDASGRPTIGAPSGNSRACTWRPEGRNPYRTIFAPLSQSPSASGHRDRHSCPGAEDHAPPPAGRSAPDEGGIIAPMERTSRVVLSLISSPPGEKVSVNRPRFTSFR